MIKLFKRLAIVPVLLAVLFLVLQILCDLILPTLTAGIVNQGIIPGDLGFIWRNGAIMLVVSLLGFAANLVNTYYASRVAFSLGRDLRRAIFTKSLSYSILEFEQLGASSLITRNTNDVTQIQNLVEMGLRLMVMSPLLMLGGIFMSYRLSPELSGIFVWVLPVLGLAVFLIFRYARPMFSLLQEKMDQLNRIFREGLTGMKVIRAFNKEQAEFKRYEAASRDYADLSIKAYTLMSAMMPVMTLIMGTASIAITWVGGDLVLSGRIEVGTIMAVITYSAQILISLMMLGMIVTFIPRGQASARRINEVLDQPLSVLDPARPLPVPVGDSLDFVDVDFRYFGAEKPTLSQVSFRVEQGQTIAVIGGTGSGKSTLINLISRFFDVEFGSVRIGGTDVRDLRLHDLRTLVSLAPQRVALFQGTVRDNLLLALPTATDAQIWEALTQAAAADFVREAGGLDAPVDKDGGNFSGGQRQRLSIARALLKPAAIYIFDDSFSALDYKTDGQIREAIARRPGPEIKIIVAQRVSTVQHADMILVLDEGRVAGFGVHEDLAACNSVYQEIILSQAEKDVEA